jgi:hypothetical protein
MLPDRGKDFPEPLRHQYTIGDYRKYTTKDCGRGSEIDIFEYMPYWQRLDGLFPIHCGTIWNYGKVTPRNPAPHGYGSYALENDGWGPGEMGLPDPSEEFHTYGLYWSPERLIFYFDSKPFFRVTDSKNIPDVPEYFIFNVALSGNCWGKNPGGKQPTMEQITEDLPNQMQIDYFRAYSGTLEEDVPTSPTDIPVVKKYSPPSPEEMVAASSPATPTPAPAPTAPATNAPPAAPINSTISTPAQ